MTRGIRQHGMAGPEFPLESPGSVATGAREAQPARASQKLGINDKATLARALGEVRGSA